jgi:2,4-dienoyl-CoA reductase-like NADH-dependent reductase (Old Yellow Enzyme family)
MHAANTYLIEQFLRDSVNDRSGPYGGSIANRARLLLEVVAAIAGEIGAGRTGIRLSPMTTFTAPLDSDPQALYGYVVEQLAPFGLAYLHVIEAKPAALRLRSAASRKGRGWSITATAAIWPCRPSPMARPTWSPLAARSSARRTSFAVCAKGLR